MAAQTPSRVELVEALQASRDRILAALRALPADAFEQGRYENGWNGRQILAHIASIEWTYPRLLDLPSRESGPSPSDGTSGGSAPGGGPDDYNARQVAKRIDATVAELLDEFERNRAATIAAVETADEAAFARAIRSAGGSEGTLGAVFMRLAVGHSEQHARDLVGDV